MRPSIYPSSRKARLNASMRLRAADSERGVMRPTRGSRPAACWAQAGTPIGGAAHAQEYKAQQAAKIARIGYLATNLAPNPHQREAFRQGLRDLGYVGGRNVVIEYRPARSSCAGSTVGGRSLPCSARTRRWRHDYRGPGRRRLVMRCAVVRGHLDDDERRGDRPRIQKRGQP